MLRTNVIILTVPLINISVAIQLIGVTFTARGIVVCGGLG